MIFSKKITDLEVLFIVNLSAALVLSHMVWLGSLGSGRREVPGGASFSHVHSKHVWIQGEYMVKPSSVSYLCAGPLGLNLPLKSRWPSCGQAEQSLWKVTRCFQDKPQVAVAAVGPSRFTSQSTCRSGPRTASHSASQAGLCTASHWAPAGEGERSWGNATDHPLPTKGLRSRSRLVLPQNPPPRHERYRQQWDGVNEIS